MVKAQYIAQRIIEHSKQHHINIISPEDPAYPVSLKFIKDYPPLLFTKGKLSLLNNPPKAALLGSRCSGSNILELTEMAGEFLIARGYTIVSGLALGCDRMAHKTALKARKGTIAVMPCGPDIIYPRENEFLYREILAINGAIFSEYSPGIHPAPYRFVERDRLQSGISQIVVLVESSIKGGSMHTALSALRQNRPLLVHRPEHFSENNSGNKYLIEEHNVFPFRDIEEFICHINRIKSILRDCNRETDQLIFPYD
jgi:DNA processing protein